MTEIEPCPNPVCQCKDVQVISGGPGCHYVKCRGCGLQTDDGRRDRQVALWNSLPRTHTAPSGEVERVAVAAELARICAWLRSLPVAARSHEAIAHHIESRDYKAAIAAMRSPASGGLAENLDYALRSALRFAASRSAITAAEEKAIIAALRQAGEG